MNKLYSLNNFQKIIPLQKKIILRHFTSRTSNSNKSIYNKSLNITKENTIDITGINENVNQNIKLELKNLDKLINRYNQKTNMDEKVEKQPDVSLDEIIPDPPINQQTFNKTSNKDNYNFDHFKQRNKEIMKKRNEDKETKDKKKGKNMEDEDEEMNEEKPLIDEKTLAKLQDLIKNDKDNKNSEYKSINPENQEDEIYNTADNEKEVLLHRPAKNFVWGLGNQTKQKKFKFVSGEYPTVEAIVSFLEVNNLQEIIVVPTHELGLIHLKENVVLCSGYTAKHTYKAAKDLVVEIKKLKIPNLPSVPSVSGRRDEPWNIVEIGNITIHFFVESYRDEIDLLGRWLNPPPEEFLEWQRRFDAKMYGKKKL